jgi:4-hydroxy-tetrahydrodipicolinate synthase
MVTPFDPAGAVDACAAERLIAHLLSNGTDGLVVCGTTGESPTLSHDEKLGLFRLARRIGGSGVPVIAGTTGNDTAASVQLTREAAELGVDAALLVVPPYNRPSQEGLYRHFKAIAESVPNLPCMLYNVPARTGQNMDATTTLRLAHDVQNIVAIKEASGNLMQISEIAAGAPQGFEIYSGDDGLTLPIVSVGGVGVVSVTGHVVGKGIQAMLSAFFSGDLATAAKLHGDMLPIVKACFQPTTASPAPTKAALNLLGIPAGGVRMPVIELNDREMGIVRTALTGYGLLS